MNKTEECINIFEQIEMTSGRNDKEAILKQNIDNDYLKMLLEYIYNPYKVYGIGKKAFKNIAALPETALNIFDLLDYLLENSTGTDKDKQFVNSFIAEQPEKYREGYKRIILKDLRIGITAKTINKIFPKLIPTFTVQLAEPFEKFYNNVACEVKIDGVRNIAVKQNGIVRMFTRNGKAVEGFNDVMNDIKNLPIDNIVFDGEIIGKDYTDTMNQLFAKGANKKGTYMIFDMITPEEFYKGESDFDYWTRKQGLIGLKKSINMQQFNNLHFIEPLKIIEKPTIEQFNELMSTVVLDGFEGIMIKPLNSMYKAKRSYDWQKLKPFMSDEFKIIGFEEGDGKYKGTLGKVLIDVDNVFVKVGSGFSDAQRNDIWLNQQQYIGREIEVQYQERIAKTGSLRFPTVKSIRLDK